MPKGAVYVGRPSLWGNPWSARELTWIAPARRREVAVARYREQLAHRGLLADYGDIGGASDARVDAVARHMDEVGASNMGEYAAVVLRGRDLACWCPLCDVHRDGLPLGVLCADCAPCHATVLLELANA